MVNQFLFSAKNNLPVLRVGAFGLICCSLLMILNKMPGLSQAGAQASGQVVQLASDETGILQASKPLITRAGAWQTWNDRIYLKHGQEKMLLLLKFINGADGREKLTGLNVQLARKPFATLKDFGGNDTQTFDLTGKLTAGNTPLTVQGFGPSGARLTWKLVTRRPVISAVSPNPIRLLDKITVQGRNFSDRPQDMKVLIGGKPAKVLSVRSSEIQLTAPAHLPGGTQDLVAKVHSVESNVFKVTVKSNPQVTFVDPLSAPPGQPVVISGSGFSSNPSDNVVKFGTTQAEIISASESTIHCIVPDMHFPTWYVPITVTTHGMRSRENAHIHVDVRVVPNEGIPMH